MTERPTQTDQELRQRAEQLLKAKEDADSLTAQTTEQQRLLHELEVRQIELEMQNEELRTAQQQLEVSQARYFDLYDLAPIGYLTLDKRRLILDCNLFAAGMMGMDHKKLIKTPVNKILLKADQIIFYKKLKACVASDMPQHFEVRLVRADKGVFWGLLQVVAMEGGEYWLTVTDISRNKQIQAQLHESNSKFSSVFEQAAVGVARVGLDGAWLEVNKKLCVILGYSQKVLLAKNFQGMTHPDDLAMDQTAYKQLINQEISTYSSEKRYFNAKNDIVWVKVTKSLVRDSNNAPDYFIAIIEDITKQKNEEAKQISLTEQLHQAQKIEAIGNLAGGIAHDFNNMLGVILGQAELVMSKLQPSHPLIKHIEAITKAATHSAKLTRQLLTFARKQNIEPKVLNLNGSVSAMIDMLKRLIGESIQLAWQPKERLWRVKVDPTQIDQVLVNLCINARDAIAGSGIISISVSNCILDDTDEANEAYNIPSGEYVKLSVSDDGCGMDQATIKHIFEPFYTTKAPGSGTGLGLSFTIGAVKMNDGFINVVSQPGRGTTFNTYFRRVENVEDSDQKSKPAPISQATETILLVEDEEMLLEIETAMLENSGYTVLAAPTGDIAEALLREHKCEIDLLVTDVIMPKINGIELALKLRTICPQLKVLFMSGYAANALGQQANFEQGSHFLQKPFSLEALTTKVREVLNTELQQPSA